MDNISVLISEEQIAKRISEMCRDINNELKGENVVAVVLLKGAFVFAADILREINSNVTLDFVRISSYGDSTVSNGDIVVEQGLSVDVKGKNVLVIEDIIDTGRTLSYFMNELKKKQPKFAKICVLLDKKERRITDISADYTGFEINDEFVVGYGLDYAQKYRNLPYIGVIQDPNL